MAELTYGREHVEKMIYLRQRRYEWGTVTSALKNLGFRESDVRRAVGALVKRFANDDAPIETVVGEGIRLLTD